MQTTPKNSRTQGAALALVPLLVFAVMFMLLVPHAAQPEGIPLPEPDLRTLEAREQEEDLLLRTLVSSEGLTADVRDLGSELRALHTAQAKGLAKLEDQRTVLSSLKERVERARAVAVGTSGMQAIRTLFVLQKRAFLDEAGGLSEHNESAELNALAGDFATRMRSAGWLTDGTLHLTRMQLAVLFKGMWSHDVGLELDPWFELSLDEKRVLFSVYLRYPRIPEGLRASLESAKANAKDTQTCADVEREIEKARETWRMEKIEVLAGFDSAYPREYALGIANYRLGKLTQAQALFRRSLELHPEGAYAMRTQNFLKATANRIEGH